MIEALFVLTTLLIGLLIIGMIFYVTRSPVSPIVVEKPPKLPVEAQYPWTVGSGKKRPETIATPGAISLREKQARDAAERWEATREEREKAYGVLRRKAAAGQRVAAWIEAKLMEMGGPVFMLYLTREESAALYQYEGGLPKEDRKLEERPMKGHDWKACYYRGISMFHEGHYFGHERDHLVDWNRVCP